MSPGDPAPPRGAAVPGGPAIAGDPAERSERGTETDLGHPERVEPQQESSGAPPAGEEAAPPAGEAEEQERAAPSGAWVSPADGTLSSGFGPRWGTFHNGVDIANEIGTPVRAGSSGTVISSGPASGYGLWVRVEHPDSTISVYGHIDSSGVEVGQDVGTGEQIATMGNRGNSTGPHLHYQIEVGGEPVDPEQFYADRGARLLG
ncbi:peptidoglycan DD-metalloendopeptidase family protein [Saccharopolyspora sp. HNM0983]|uniref:Peptidoglycan DD-metalloendopeptidase family protein n=2 Tax=Saccharopolyspora montiporae TaxID=2781240 RepID=A0A929G0Z9_9PSEU|nr:peptidoglycan DD-metalloendopeptidase family protein [Saccharopolyspora sp. HNM0983]